MEMVEVDQLIYTRLIDESGRDRDYQIVAKSCELDEKDTQKIILYGMGRNPPYDVKFTDCRRMFYLPSGKICLGLTKDVGEVGGRPGTLYSHLFILTREQYLKLKNPMVFEPNYIIDPQLRMIEKIRIPQGYTPRWEDLNLVNELGEEILNIMTESLEKKKKVVFLTDEHRSYHVFYFTLLELLPFKYRLFPFVTQQFSVLPTFPGDDEVSLYNVLFVHCSRYVPENGEFVCIRIGSQVSLHERASFRIPRRNYLSYAWHNKEKIGSFYENIYTLEAIYSLRDIPSALYDNIFEWWQINQIRTEHLSAKDEIRAGIAIFPVAKNESFKHFESALSLPRLKLEEYEQILRYTEPDDTWKEKIWYHLLKNNEITTLDEIIEKNPQFAEWVIAKRKVKQLWYERKECNDIVVKMIKKAAEKGKINGEDIDFIKDLVAQMPSGDILNIYIQWVFVYRPFGLWVEEVKFIKRMLNNMNLTPDMWLRWIGEYILSFQISPKDKLSFLLSVSELMVDKKNLNTEKIYAFLIEICTTTDDQKEFTDAFNLLKEIVSFPYSYYPLWMGALHGAQLLIRNGSDEQFLGFYRENLEYLPISKLLELLCNSRRDWFTLYKMLEEYVPSREKRLYYLLMIRGLYSLLYDGAYQYMRVHNIWEKTTAKYFDKYSLSFNAYEENYPFNDEECQEIIKIMELLWYNRDKYKFSLWTLERLLNLVLIEKNISEAHKSDIFKKFSKILLKYWRDICPPPWRFSFFMRKTSIEHRTIRLERAVRVLNIFIPLFRRYLKYNSGVIEEDELRNIYDLVSTFIIKTKTEDIDDEELRLVKIAINTYKELGDKKKEKKLLRKSKEIRSIGKGLRWMVMKNA